MQKGIHKRCSGVLGDLSLVVNGFVCKRSDGKPMKVFYLKTQWWRISKAVRKLVGIELITTVIRHENTYE